MEEKNPESLDDTEQFAVMIDDSELMTALIASHLNTTYGVTAEKIAQMINDGMNDGANANLRHKYLTLSAKVIPKMAELMKTEVGISREEQKAIALIRKEVNLAEAAVSAYRKSADTAISKQTRIQKERDQWKRKAQTAERKSKSLRQRA